MTRWRPVGWALGLAFAVAILVWRVRPPVSSREVREFTGAYPAASQPNGVIREFSLRAAPTELPLLDGRTLAVWAYNGQVPGPTLRVKLGETVRVTLKNDLPQSTTIHWHGVRLPNAMDGVPDVTQPPVQPGQVFVYEFTPKDAGTFWFHPHLAASEQIERGLFGVLIVDDVRPPPYSRDVVWVLDDWLLTPDGQMIAPEFNTRHDLAHDGRWGNIVTVNGSAAEELHIQAGERIRLRLVNVANGRVFAPDFSGFDAHVIAVDGMYASRPVDPSGFELAPGNRLDLDVTFAAAKAGQTFVVTDRFTRRPVPLAKIVVSSDVIPTPVFDSPAHAHVPEWSGASALSARAEYRLNARAGGRFGIEWMLNDEPFDHDSHGQQHTIQVLPYGEWSKLRFVNESYRLHPMHLHGQFFKLLARNGQRMDEPFFRDTVLLHAKETVEVGLVPQDEGTWMLHCHVLEHAESGMMALVKVQR